MVWPAMIWQLVVGIGIGMSVTVAPADVGSGASCAGGAGQCELGGGGDEVSHLQLIGREPASSSTARADMIASKQPAANYTNVACVGDSITFGYHAMNGFQAYPAQLQQLLGEPLGPQLLFNVQNFGYSGAMVTKIPKDTLVYEELKRDGKTPYWDTDEFQSSMTAQWNPKYGTAGPDVVIIQLGTNDANNLTWPTWKKEFVLSYLELINTYKSLPTKPKVFISIPPPIFIDGAYSLIQDVINDQYPEMIPFIAQQANLSKPIPVHHVFKRHCPRITKKTTDCDWISGAGFGTPPTPPFNDGVHPNSNGYHAIALTVLPYVFSQEAIG